MTVPNDETVIFKVVVLNPLVGRNEPRPLRKRGSLVNRNSNIVPCLVCDSSHFITSFVWQTALPAFNASLNKKNDQRRKNVQPSSRALSPNPPSKLQQKANNVTPVDKKPVMDAGRAGTPEVQADNQSQSQASRTQESKSSSRGYDIVNSIKENQGVPQDPSFGKPKRSGTNPNLTASNVSEENEILRRRNAELQRLVDGLQQDMSNQRERIQQAESQLRGVSRQLRESQEKAHLLEIENERQKIEANSTIQSMEKEHTQHKAADEAQIRRLLEGATRNKVEGRWNPPPDEDIRRRLTLLNSNVREWARDWATKSLVIDKATSKETNKYFGDFVRLDPDGSLPPLVRTPSAKTKSKIAGLLLYAALSHEIHDAFFDGKFFCLTLEDRLVLERLFNEMRQADPKNATIWRAGLWRLLNPNVPEGQTKIPSILEASRNNIKAYCETMSATFRNKPASILFSVVAENSAEAQNRATKLRAILQSASTIAISLWTQHSKYTAVDLKGIHQFGMTFDNSSPVLEAHPWSDVDEDNDKANGRGILMVVKPALIAFDAEDTKGWEGDQYRVLNKSLVLLDGN